MSTESVTLVVLEVGDETERLIGRVQRGLAEEAAATSPELPTLYGTTVTVEFNDGRPADQAEQRLRQVLDEADPEWAERLGIPPRTDVEAYMRGEEVCEDHPDKPRGHDGCRAPGMPPRL